MNSKRLRRAVTDHVRKKLVLRRWFYTVSKPPSSRLFKIWPLRFSVVHVCSPHVLSKTMLFRVLTRACSCSLPLKFKLLCLSSPLDLEHSEGRCAVLAHSPSPCSFPFWPPGQPPAVQGALRPQHEEVLRNLSLRVRHLSTVTGLAFMK